jgi:hypothetical protein
MATVLLLGAAGVVIAVVATRDSQHGAGATHDVGPLALPVVPDAAIDAGAVVAAPDAVEPDAAAPDAVAPIDAGPDAAPIDAPSKRHRSHGTPPHPGSGSTTPPGCDRSIDTDCDGIPDVR